MVEQEISTRMVVRVEALHAVEKAVLPAFCDEMTCNFTSNATDASESASILSMAH